MSIETWKVGWSRKLPSLASLIFSKPFEENTDNYCEATLEEKFSNFDFLNFMKESLKLVYHEEEKELKKLTLEKRLFQKEIKTVRRKCGKEIRIKTRLTKKDRGITKDSVGCTNACISTFKSMETIHGRVREVTKEYLEISIFLRRRKRQITENLIDINSHYNIEFSPNDIPTRIALRAINSAVDKKMKSFLQNFETNRHVSVNQYRNIRSWEFKWINFSIRDNEEQKAAVRNIVNRSSFPSPYVVFGPPGTGKTTTICEAILQVMKLRLNSHILVTADSNSTCDDITIRLLKFIDEDKIIFRVYSSSKFEEIPEDLKRVSNFCNSLSEDEDTLSLDDFKKARIIVCTLVTCGQIVGIHHNLPDGHFDYIFIDEAGCQSEQNTLIPIAGLAYTKFKGITSQIILSGDHKQLGAVVKCEKSKEMGMEISMMERMMTIVPKYKEFREDCVSYLVKNYRSHKAIIEFSNTQFYNGKLEYLCPSEKKDFAVGWESLRNKQFPVLFHHSSSDRKFIGKSCINYGEAKIALNYVKSLMKNGISGKFVQREDIGVIAPYKAQVYLLDKIINKIYRKIEVGTVNAFQGREKKVIILTTVQSNSKSIGFLKNDKRLNVSLTRAQSLLIIIGNSNTLRTSPMWSKFVEYCNKNGSVVYPKNEKNDNILSSILPDSKLTIKKDGNKKKNNRRRSKSKISQIRY